MWRQKTNKGRVVYDTKINRFSDSDLRRVAITTGNGPIEIPGDAWGDFYKALNEFLSEWPTRNAIKEGGIDFQFGGGKFGGGGVTRNIDGFSEIPSILIILKERE